MKKETRKMKTIKGIMAGAVALTPVIAVGVNADQASAAELTTGEEAAIGSFITKFNLLDETKQELVRLVLFHIGDNPSYTLDTAAASLSSQYSSLLKFNSTNAITVESLTSKYSSFKEAAATIESDATSAHLVEFFNSVLDNLVIAVNSMDSSDYGNLLDSEILTTFQSLAIATELQPFLKKPTPSQAVGLIADIQDDFDHYRNPGSPNPTPNPTPTPEPPVDKGDGVVEIGGGTVETNPQQVVEAIKNAETIKELVISVAKGAESVAVPATIFNALNTKNPDAVVVISTPTGSYELPVAAVNLQELAAQLNVASAELKVEIKVVEVETPASVTASGLEILSPSIEFEVTVIAPNGESIVLKNFPKPVKRTVTAPQQLNPLTTVGVTVIDGQVRAVPTFVAAGNLSADLFRAGNSTYTLVENSKTFKDIDKGASWSEEFVEKLASRMIVNGTTATTYEPNRAISRGEFAAILSRGLGLVPKTTEVAFTDVSASQAFNKYGEIASVVEAGIVKGDANGKFRPYDEISRDEAAIMISRALDYIGTDAVKLDTSKKLTAFTDYRYIGSTARPHVERVLQAGYIGGYSDGSFGASDDTERGQMAKILYNFLQSIKFIN